MMEIDPMIGPNTQTFSGANTTTIATVATHSCVITFAIFEKTFSFDSADDVADFTGVSFATFFVDIFFVAIFLKVITR